MKRIPKKWTATAVVAAVAIAGAGFGLQAANADSAPAFQVYDEPDSPNPYNVTNALVFYKGADLGWTVNTPITGIHSLAYTVADSESYAPSFQLVTKSDQKSYARLVWEPYQQKSDSGFDKGTGAYTDLQDGVWWTNKITSGPGSQSDPQPLAFFTTPVDEGGAGWTNLVVGAIDVHQGTTSDITSTVTKVSFNGSDVPLGNPDTTPFDQAFVDSALATATAPLDSKITELEADVKAKEGEITRLNGIIDSLTDAKGATEAVKALGDQVTELSGQITALQGKIDALTAQETALTAYKATHHTADGTNIGESRALLSATPVHGKTVGITKSGTLATSKASSLKYQWYLSGKAVSGATKSTYLVPSSAKGKSVSVKVTATYNKYIVFSVHSNTVSAK